MCRSTGDGGRRCSGAGGELTNARRRIAHNASKAARHRAAGNTAAAEESERLADLARAEVADLEAMEHILDGEDLLAPEQPTPAPEPANDPELTPEQRAAAEAFERLVAEVNAGEPSTEQVTLARSAVAQAERDLAEAQVRHEAAEARGDRQAVLDAEEAVLHVGAELRQAKEAMEVARIMAEQQAGADMRAAMEDANRAQREAAELARQRKEQHYDPSQPGVVMKRVRGGYRPVLMTPEQLADVKEFEQQHGRPPVAPYEIYLAQQEAHRQRTAERAAAQASGDLAGWEAGVDLERTKLVKQAKTDLAKAKRRLAREQAKADREVEQQKELKRRKAAAARRKKKH